MLIADQFCPEDVDKGIRQDLVIPYGVMALS